MPVILQTSGLHGNIWSASRTSIPLKIPNLISSHVGTDVVRCVSTFSRQNSFQRLKSDFHTSTPCRRTSIGQGKKSRGRFQEALFNAGLNFKNFQDETTWPDGLQDIGKRCRSLQSKSTSSSVELNEILNSHHNEQTLSDYLLPEICPWIGRMLTQRWHPLYAKFLEQLPGDLAFCFGPESTLLVPSVPKPDLLLGVKIELPSACPQGKTYRDLKLPLWAVELKRKDNDIEFARLKSHNFGIHALKNIVEAERKRTPGRFQAGRTPIVIGAPLKDWRLELWGY